MGFRSDDAAALWPSTVPDVRETEPVVLEVHCPTCHRVWTLEDALSGGRFGLLAWHRYQCRTCEDQSQSPPEFGLLTEQDE